MMGTVKVQDFGHSISQHFHIVMYRFTLEFLFVLFFSVHVLLF